MGVVATHRWSWRILPRRWVLPGTYSGSDVTGLGPVFFKEQSEMEKTSSLCRQREGLLYKLISKIVLFFEAP